jgi:hypothetical protein
VQGSDLIFSQDQALAKSMQHLLQWLRLKGSETGPRVKPRKLLEPLAKQLIALHQSSNCHPIT